MESVMRKKLNVTIGVLGAFSMLAAAAATGADSYAEDRAKIEDLMGRYLFAMDWRDAEAYASTFTEDGVLDYASGVEKGRAAIAGMVNRMRENEIKRNAEAKLRPARTRHNITNTIIKIDGNKATARSYWTAYANDNPERKAEISSYGHYEDELVKQNGQWLFTKRVIYNEQLDKRAASGKPVGW
jgi:uncharacterized protein (TIGR02246 family)